jgi:HEPN domain-containing protein
MNETSAKEWLTKAWHHLGSGKILYEAHHYTDTIAVDLHYAVEIMLKSFLAYQNKKIIKTHSLIDIYKAIMDYIQFYEEELDILDLITTYHIKEAYPPMYRELPSRDEIKEVLLFSENLFQRVCKILDIKIDE